VTPPPLTSPARSPYHAAAVHGGTHAVTRMGVRAMTWETPTFVEVKMDAELTSYQNDLEEI
jgi:hypothetical protein